MTLAEMEKIANGKGYAPTISREGCIEIQRIDEENIFPDDEEAVEAAIKDGIPIIPVDELPENFEYRYLGWIDTPENRSAIKNLCLAQNERK